MLLAPGKLMVPKPLKAPERGAVKKGVFRIVGQRYASIRGRHMG